MHHGGGGGGAGHGHGGHHGGHGAHSHHHHGGAPSSSASWNMAMQADSFWVNMLKANSKPLLVVFAVIGTLFGWLFFIHYLHHQDSPEHVVSADVWNQQLTSVNPREAPLQSFSQPAAGQGSGYVAQSDAPSAFGAPRSADESQSGAAAPMNNRTYSNRTTPSLAPLMFSHFMPGGYQAQSSGAPAFSAAALSAPASNAAPGFAMPQQLMPTRVHSAERYRMVVSR